MIFPDNTRKIIFQRYFFGNTIFPECLEKENMVFCAVKMTVKILCIRFRKEFSYLLLHLLVNFFSYPSLQRARLHETKTVSKVTRQFLLVVKGC